MNPMNIVAHKIWRASWVFFRIFYFYAFDYASEQQQQLSYTHAEISHAEIDWIGKFENKIVLKCRKIDWLILHRHGGKFIEKNHIDDDVDENHCQISQLIEICVHGRQICTIDPDMYRV